MTPVLLTKPELKALRIMLTSVWSSKLNKQFLEVATAAIRGCSQSAAVILADESAVKMIKYHQLVESCMIPLVIGENSPRDQVILKLDTNQYQTLRYVVECEFVLNEVSEDVRNLVKACQPTILAAFESGAANYDSGDDVRQTIFLTPEEKA